MDNNYLIPAPKDKSDKPQKSPYDERQGDGYYPKRILYNENDERDTSVIVGSITKLKKPGATIQKSGRSSS
ncbi:hypothetical protein C8039_19465 [Halogeometricum sp. wsp3]|nr:hypothetical protein C8039_19465 [Halogeometricum sp. wsp3]